MKKTLKELFKDLKYWSDTYEFYFQFCGDSMNNVHITKGGVYLYEENDLETPEEAVRAGLKYVNKINGYVEND